MEEEAAKIEQYREEVKHAIEEEKKKGTQGNPTLLRVNPSKLTPKTLILWGKLQEDNLTKEEVEATRMETESESSDGWLVNQIANKLTEKVMQESLKAEEAA
ncbi:hypothetical protein HYV21_01395 [Candidatus Microgenomates bacterium]|nr:hypothetical protein [Candidatus Microgenomates bacterium]